MGFIDGMQRMKHGGQKIKRPNWTEGSTLEIEDNRMILTTAAPFRGEWAPAQQDLMADDWELVQPEV